MSRVHTLPRVLQPMTTLASALEAWRTAEARAASFVSVTDEDEMAAALIDDDCRSLALTAATTPATGLADVAAKLELLEHVICAQHRCGRFTDRRDEAILAAIKADVHRLHG